VKALYKAAKEHRKTVICIDEFGPLELRPYAGRSWRRKGHPERFRAVYSRKYGIRQLIAGYDVGSGKMFGHFRKRKRALEIIAFLKSVRRMYSGEIWIVLDNLSAHKTKEVRNYACLNNIRFQFLPTNASWLNRIECQFTHLKKNVLTHCDYRTFDDMRIAINKYLKWRNKQVATT
jgi:transposase